MTRQLLDSLLVHAEEMRKVWDGKNINSDRWEEVETVVPCSETTAVITIRKASNMRVVILAVWVKTQGGKWTHFSRRMSIYTGCEMKDYTKRWMSSKSKTPASANRIGKIVPIN